MSSYKYEERRKHVHEENNCVKKKLTKLLFKVGVEFSEPLHDRLLVFIPLFFEISVDGNGERCGQAGSQT